MNHTLDVKIHCVVRGIRSNSISSGNTFGIVSFFSCPSRKQHEQAGNSSTRDIRALCVRVFFSPTNFHSVNGINVNCKIVGTTNNQDGMENESALWCARARKFPGAVEPLT